VVAGIGLAAGVAIGSLWIAQRFEWALYDRMTTAAFSEALAAYRAQEWNTADRILREVMASDPSDHAAPVFLKRCEFYARHPPSERWDGIHVMTTK
jgi:hypothetical protein